MARPRQSLGRTNPGINQGLQAVTLADMGAQIQDVTLVANSAGSVNTILNSLLTTNVIPLAYPIKGYSYHVTYAEATDPTRSAVFISVFASGISAAPGNINVPSRVFLVQRDE